MERLEYIDVYCSNELKGNLLIFLFFDIMVAREVS